MQEKIISKNRKSYEIIRFIASGAQGEVFEVRNTESNRHFAYKRYFQSSATPYRRKLIERLIKRGAPDGRFLWPLDMVEEKGVFGYIMELRGKEYFGIVDLMKRKASPSFAVLCKTAINLADSYQSLHSMGLCYRDISFGNLFFNPQNGAVLICDNDNVTVNMDNEESVFGTPRFIAPEIINKEAFASTQTDLYSLAVLIFYIFMLHHPLEGEKEAQIRCYDEKAMNKIFGKEPVFIWNPDDDSNRPVKGYQDNAIIFWEIYPEFFREMFIRAFTAGLKNPNRRIVEKQWKDCFVKLWNSIVYCSCGAENFYDQNKKEKGRPHKCWSCNKPIAFPPALVLGGSNIILNHDRVIYKHHLYGDFDFDTPFAKVTRHPESGRWGLLNLSPEEWAITKKNGEGAVIPCGKSLALTDGLVVGMGIGQGEIRSFGGYL